MREALSFVAEGRDLSVEGRGYKTEGRDCMQMRWSFGWKRQNSVVESNMTKCWRFWM